MCSWLSGLQVGSKNRSKIDPKMESKMECILASIFERFWWILAAKLGSGTRKAHARHTPGTRQAHPRHTQGTRKAHARHTPGTRQGVQVGSKNRPTIDLKMNPKIQCILSSNFERFWWILAAKLGSSWRQVDLKSRWQWF